MFLHRGTENHKYHVPGEEEPYLRGCVRWSNTFYVVFHPKHFSIVRCAALLSPSTRLLSSGQSNSATTQRILYGYFRREFAPLPSALRQPSLVSAYNPSGPFHLGTSLRAKLFKRQAVIRSRKSRHTFFPPAPQQELSTPVIKRYCTYVKLAINIKNRLDRQSTHPTPPPANSIFTGRLENTHPPLASISFHINHHTRSRHPFHCTEQQAFSRLEDKASANPHFKLCCGARAA